ncbi:alanine-phosphoribitol ligase [Spinactinospora alkalitolerans]
MGGGQSALYLGHGLLRHGYEVTLMTAQTTEEVRAGLPSVLQFTPPTVLLSEREAGLPVWENDAPPIERLRMRVRTGAHEVAFTGAFSAGYAVSVDRRLKMADWLELFKARADETGHGRVITHGVTVTDLDYFTRLFDLVIVAVGNGELGELFDPDPTRQGGAHPRTVVQAYLDGDTVDGPAEGVMDVVSAQPGGPDDAGEVFFAPVLTHEGAGYAVMALAAPGGPLDAAVAARRARERVRHAFSPDLALHTLLTQTKTWAPEVFARIAHARPIRGSAVLGQRVDPVVRHPVGVLPSGGLVLGMADAVVTTGPLCGQGWNTSTRCAQVYLEHVLAHGDRPFDEMFMDAAFTAFWDTYGEASAAFSEISHGVFPAHFPHLLGAAGAFGEVADRWVDGIDDPRKLRDWMFDAERAHAYLAQLTTSAS